MPSSYESLGVVQLFQLVSDARKELGPSRAQVLAWRRAVQALDEHRNNLESLRGQLAAKWPPECNAASAAYLEELDRLIQAINQTSASAASNGTHIDHVANAIEKAQEGIEPLHREYVENQKKLAQYESLLNDLGGKAAIAGGPLGGWVTKNVAEKVMDSPVSDGRQEELARQARAEMVPLTGTVTDAVNNMQGPPKYAPPKVDIIEDTGRDVGRAADGGAVRPPKVDPPAHTQAQPETPPAVPDANGGSGGRDTDASPGLEGVIAPAQPPIGKPADVGPQIGAPSPVTGPPPVLPIQHPGARPATSQCSTGRFFSSPHGGPGTIGGGGGANVGKAPAGPSRVDPVGGLIGGPAGGSRGPMSSPAGRPGAGMMPANGQLGSLGMSRHRPETEGLGDRVEKRWDPDNPWETAEGVAPVIEPRPVSRIDPGPGILGMDL